MHTLKPSLFTSANFYKIGRRLNLYKGKGFNFNILTQQLKKAELFFTYQVRGRKNNQYLKIF